MLLSSLFPRCVSCKKSFRDKFSLSQHKLDVHRNDYDDFERAEEVVEDIEVDFEAVSEIEVAKQDLDECASAESVSHFEVEINVAKYERYVAAELFWYKNSWKL